MTTQVQSMIEPEYTAVVEVAEDGETLTEAILINTAVALGNRIEYVRQLVAEAADVPEKFTVLREDFLGAVHDGTSVLYADLVWRTEHTGSPAISHNGGTASNPGKLVLAMPPDTTFFAGLGNPTHSPFGMITTKAITMVVAVNDNVANVVTGFSIGLKNDWSLTNGGSDALTLFYSKATSANWMLMVRKASANINHDLGIPVVNNEFVTCRFIKNGNDIDVYLDGDLVHTVLSADKPTGELNFGFDAVTTVAETEVFTATIDFISIRSELSGLLPRSGV